MTLDRDCPNCKSTDWLDTSRSLSQLERDSNCEELWACQVCGMEVIIHETEGMVPRETYSPLSNL